MDAVAPATPLLDTITSPADLKQLDERDLPQLADELRLAVVHSVAKTGGHLGASLGTIELTVALHYVFDTPHDQLVWDVGHQTYGHKILTGRRDRMDSIRKRDGLAGFPKREESEYDTFGVGHSSTSISAALGMALASRETQNGPRIAAVIGDGALTAGLAYEALNHAGDERADMLVVLNDNDMSISPNVGGMNKYLARMLSGKVLSGAREGGKRVLSKLPTMFELARRTEEHVKGMVVPSTLFEELGFNYFGPIDGHDVTGLVAVLKNLRDMDGPVFLHAVTRKGHGYEFAEKDALAMHAVTPFDPDTGKPKSTGGGPNTPTYTRVFGDWLIDAAEADPRVVGITPAMREGSGLVEFEQRFPDRYVDVGIAEQHAVTLAAGLACGGMKPVVAIYSTFLQRAFDQLVHDVAIQNLPVVFAVDRAGLVGPDGPTHAGSFDFSYMRPIPNMTIMAPADENECRQMLHTALQLDSPTSVRYPRGRGPGIEVQEEMTALAVGKGEIKRHGSRVALLAFGTMVEPAIAAGVAHACTVVNMRFVKPLDTELIEALAKAHEMLVTLEENAIPGGAGAGVLEHLAAIGTCIPVHLIGLPDSFIDHGSRDELLAAAALDNASVLERVGALVNDLGDSVGSSLAQNLTDSPLARTAAADIR